ncbi:uncharacterized protein Dana_GF22354 [Drosophila ananassae]|uniref:BZIP domain-containing protein n=1 Tax=Drosophila ananassae TaxID=7217 RepID=B3MVZ4_DROAN|nr:protein sisterless A [Drosophila ananassae]EDV35139.1 uncharacterized protein Dana_GF22354 [Drosophila ananassae]
MERSHHLYLPKLSYAPMGHVYGAPYSEHPTTGHSKPEQIEEMVAQQLHHLKMHYADEEQRYVDQMILENPIVVERRVAPPPPAQPASDPSPSTSSGHRGGVARSSADSKDAQRQRAESCRKSRYNNKIKKARLRFRHKFVSGQLQKSAEMLDTMRSVIAQAERQLVERGLPRSVLEQMRRSHGLDVAMQQ